MSDVRRMPSTKAIMAHWAAWFEKRHDDVIEDGVCFACGLEDKYEGKSLLERAHITARCNGGADCVENLHMLCHDCHKASEYYEDDDYWAWLSQWTTFDALMLRFLRVGMSITGMIKAQRYESSTHRMPV